MNNTVTHGARSKVVCVFVFRNWSKCQLEKKIKLFNVNSWNNVSKGLKFISVVPNEHLACCVKNKGRFLERKQRHFFKYACDSFNKRCLEYCSVFFSHYFLNLPFFCQRTHISIDARYTHKWPSTGVCKQSSYLFLHLYNSITSVTRLFVKKTHHIYPDW